MPPDSTSAQQLATAMFVKDIRADGLHFPYVYGNQQLGEFMANESNMNKFKQILDEEWDLLILDELFGVHSFGLALYFKRLRNTPYIIYSTTAMIQTSAYSLALGRNLVAEPYLITTTPTSDQDVYSPTKFYDRLNNIYDSTADLLLVKLYAERFQMYNIAKMGLPNFTWHELYKKNSLIFADYIDRMKYSLTESSDVRGIGSNCAIAKPLPRDLEDFVSDPTSNGTIYIAFGSNVNWKFAPARILDAFFEAINKFDNHRVVFSYNGVPRTGVKAHVKLVKWAPQFDVLAHPKTKMFISHGGLKSFKETICAKQPVIFMPVFAEQTYNTKLALRMRYASVVNKFNLDAEQLSGAISKVLYNNSYKSNAEKAYSLYLDRPIESLDQAIFDIERVLKRPNHNVHFLRKGIDLSWLTMFYVDWIAVFIVLLFLMKDLSKAQVKKIKKVTYDYLCKSLLSRLKAPPDWHAYVIAGVGDNKCACYCPMWSDRHFGTGKKEKKMIHRRLLKAIDLG
uniref:glucuronosyltransferase n=1 Tax=Ditylenchus dipsaci TaxID=166011 RepID=A0A915EFY7_9BILA